ncbi:MAG: hypothetical protein HN411_06795 [Waddliaceae bacterium]|nr:hypothetical protein [Waddliaceae bacterium]MBT4444330.1 hypothetical protein [Waddliaceae bacterium]MBT7264067.1 hypothetical protein [Waddliaceae bacterium]
MDPDLCIPSLTNPHSRASSVDGSEMSGDPFVVHSIPSKHLSREIAKTRAVIEAYRDHLNHHFDYHIRCCVPSEYYEPVAPSLAANIRRLERLEYRQDSEQQRLQSIFNRSR